MTSSLKLQKSKISTLAKIIAKTIAKAIANQTLKKNKKVVQAVNVFFRWLLKHRLYRVASEINHLFKQEIIYIKFNFSN